MHALLSRLQVGEAVDIVILIKDAGSLDQFVSKNAIFRMINTFSTCNRKNQFFQGWRMISKNKIERKGVQEDLVMLLGAFAQNLIGGDEQIKILQLLNLFVSNLSSHDYLEGELAPNTNSC